MIKTAGLQLILLQRLQKKKTAKKHNVSEHKKKVQRTEYMKMIHDETDRPCAWKSSFSVLSCGESARLARWWLLCKVSVSYDKPS